MINLVTDGSTVDWGFEVQVCGIFDEPCEAEKIAYLEEQRRLRESSEKSLQMAIWLTHKLCSSVNTVPAHLKAGFFNEANFRILKKFHFHPRASLFQDQMVLILGTFITELIPQLATNAQLKKEFEELESNVVSSLRVRYGLETDKGTKMESLSTSFQAAVQLVVSLQASLAAASSVAHPPSTVAVINGKAAAVDDNSSGGKVALQSTKLGSSATSAMDFGWKTFVYPHQSDSNHIYWEITIVKMGLTLPVIGLVADTNTSRTIPIGKNIKQLEIAFSGKSLTVNGEHNVDFAVPVKSWSVGDIILVGYSKDVGTVGFSVNYAAMPLSVGPVNLGPMVEMGKLALLLFDCCFADYFCF